MGKNYESVENSDEAFTLWIIWSINSGLGLHPII